MFSLAQYARNVLLTNSLPSSICKLGFALTFDDLLEPAQDGRCGLVGYHLTVGQMTEHVHFGENESFAVTKVRQIALPILIGSCGDGETMIVTASSHRFDELAHLFGRQRQFG